MVLSSVVRPTWIEPSEGVCIGVSLPIPRLLFRLMSIGAAGTFVKQWNLSPQQSWKMVTNQHHLQKQRQQPRALYGWHAVCCCCCCRTSGACLPSLLEQHAVFSLRISRPINLINKDRDLQEEVVVVYSITHTIVVNEYSAIMTLNFMIALFSLTIIVRVLG